MGALPSEKRNITILLLPSYAWLTVTIFLPLSAMLFFSFLSESPFNADKWNFTLDNYRQFLSQGFYFDLLWKSLKLSLTVTTICVVVGFPCAFVLAKHVKGRWREALFLLIILPFWSNALVRIFSWAIVLRGNGVLDAILNAVLPFEVSVSLLFTYWAVVIGLVHSYLPYVILTSYLALQAIDDHLIEAARSMGAPKWMILWHVILPLSIKGILAGAILTFVPVVGTFMEPRILGGTQGTFYGTVIEDQFVAVDNWPLGSALSFILLAAVIVILAIGQPALKRA